MGIKYSFDEQFFDNWTPQMAYVLGFLYADGNIIHAVDCRGYYISFSSSDLEIIKKIKTVLKSEHSIIKCLPPEEPRGNIYARKIHYKFRIGSKKLYEKLTSYGLHPNKSLTITCPSIPSSCISNFVRGYFDGDGCVHIEKQKGRTSTRLMIVFTSGSKEFLIGLEQFIRQETGIEKHNINKSKKAFQLKYSTKDSEALFDFMYKSVYDELYLERKKNIFTKFIKA